MNDRSNLRPDIQIGDYIVCYLPPESRHDYNNIYKFYILDGSLTIGKKYRVIDSTQHIINISNGWGPLMYTVESDNGLGALRFSNELFVTIEEYERLRDKDIDNIVY